MYVVNGCDHKPSIKNVTGELKYHLKHKHREIYHKLAGLNVDLDEVDTMVICPCAL